MIKAAASTLSVDHSKVAGKAHGASAKASEAGSFSAILGDSNGAATASTDTSDAPAAEAAALAQPVAVGKPGKATGKNLPVAAKDKTGKSKSDTDTDTKTDSDSDTDPSEAEMTAASVPFTLAGMQTLPLPPLSGTAPVTNTGSRAADSGTATTITAASRTLPEVATAAAVGVPQSSASDNALAVLGLVQNALPGATAQTSATSTTTTIASDAATVPTEALVPAAVKLAPVQIVPDATPATAAQLAARMTPASAVQVAAAMPAPKPSVAQLVTASSSIKAPATSQVTPTIPEQTLTAAPLVTTTTGQTAAASQVAPTIPQQTPTTAQLAAATSMQTSTSAQQTTVGQSAPVSGSPVFDGKVRAADRQQVVASAEPAAETEAPAATADIAAASPTHASPIPFVADAVQPQTAATTASSTVQATSSVQGPQDFGTLVSRLNEAREATSPQLVRTAINHSEFGQISLQFRHEDNGLSVTMANSDPAFAGAVQAAASASMASGSNSNSDNASQNQQQQQHQQHASASSQQQAAAGGGAGAGGGSGQNQQARADQAGQSMNRGQGTASRPQDQDASASGQDRDGPRPGSGIYA